MTTDNNRIKYAIYLDGWNYQCDDRNQLISKGRKVVPSEYSSNMNGSLFCPGCFTALSRSPKEKQFFSNGRKACFIHLPTFSHIECDLRTPKPEGMLYPTEEIAKQAIADDQLAIISNFRSEAPVKPSGDSAPYDQSAVEDVAGPISRLPISRHNGETFKLPSKISTVAGICRRFDENLYKYYVLPNKNIATRLINSIVSVLDIEEINDEPQLYFGEIISSHNAGNTPKPTNLRMTRLRCNKKIKDFYLKAIDSSQSEKGITDASVGRIVLVWGKVTWNGIGLCFEHLKWGEYALLPDKYNNLLLK